MNKISYTSSNAGRRDTQELREKLEKDVVAFLKNGGVIQQIPIGTTSMSMSISTNNIIQKLDFRSDSTQELSRRSKAKKEKQKFKNGTM
tara:strand:- start:436 stop:702 length:267 start_codon:yes stop_codon:yes gene_type:complete